MLHYLKHLVTPTLMSAVMLGMILQGAWMWLGFAAIVVFLVGGDGILPDDYSKPDYKHKWILNAVLYFTLPYLCVMLALLAWTTGSGQSDFLQIGAAVQALFGYDMIAARETNQWHHYVGAIFGVGLAVAGYGTNVAHELTHRTWDPKALLAGRWLLGMSSNADFAIEHVYGHHETVATGKDPATALRGDNVYWFVLRSTLRGHLSAWRLESERLRKKRKAIWGPSNMMLTGYLITGVYAAAFAIAGGWLGVAVFFGMSFFAKAVLEVVNYMEHYGLIRIEGQPVKPRHSWNTNRTVSFLVLFSLTRHSAHHEKGDLPFWDLEPYREAPEMPYGYLTTIFIALVPPLWHRVIVPRLVEWDETHASPEERALAREHNLKSGIRALVERESRHAVNGAAVA